MGIINLTKESLKEEFKKTELPKQNFSTYVKYVCDLDAYYTLGMMDSPRIPSRIYYRAQAMTITYHQMILDGYSHKFADYTARCYACVPNKVIQHDFVSFLVRYITRNIKFEEKRVTGDIFAYCRNIPNTDIKHKALVAALLKSGFDLNTDVVERITVPKEKIDSFYKINFPSDDLLSAIDKMEHLIGNKHLRHHCLVANNDIFSYKKILVPILKADEILRKCFMITEDPDNYIRPGVNNDMMYLLDMIETARDIYHVY